jgi:hypothetical protein
MRSADMTDGPRPAPALLRALAPWGGWEAVDLDLMRYDNGSCDLFLTLHVTEPVHRAGRWQVVLPFSPGEGWHHDPMDVEEGAFFIQVRVDEWLAGAAKANAHRLPDAR